MTTDAKLQVIPCTPESMFTKAKNRAYRIISWIISICICICLNPIQANAKVLNIKQHEEMQKELCTLTTLLSDVMEDKLDECMADVKSEIIEKGYDYDLTMEAMREGDPYAGFDYVSIIAAYMASKQYYRETNKGTFPGIISLPLIRSSYTVSSASVVKPVAIDSYEEVGDGLYRKTGKIYAVSQTKAYEYEEMESGLYERRGEIKIEPETEEVDYLVVHFMPMGYKDLFEYMDIPEEEIEESYEKIKETLLSEVTTEELRQSMWINTPSESIPELIDEFDDGEYDDIGMVRKTVCLNAMSLIGMVPYEWGGKASHGGYDETWWSFRDGGGQKGLDCSGFVQWDFMTTGVPQSVWADMYSTHQMLRSPMKSIAYEDLKPGDIGVKIGAIYNHTGIYMGKKNGRAMWAHCSSAQNSVTVSEYDFQVFYDPYSPESGRWNEELEAFSAEYGGVDWYDDAAFEDIFHDKLIDLETPIDEEVISDTEPERDLKVTEAYSADEDGYFGDLSEPEEEEVVVVNTENTWKNNLNLIKNRVWEKFLEKNLFVDVDKQELGYIMHNTVSTNFSEKEVHLLAQLIVHEALAEGLNGWIAVAEVVKNRVASPLFPDTITEVIYQNGQFADSGSLPNITPPTDIENIALAVLESRTGVLENPNVLYFRNPRYAGYSAEDRVDWGSHTYFTNVGHHAFYLQ